MGKKFCNFLIIFLFFYGSLSSQTRQSLEEQRRNLETEIRDLNRFLREAVREHEQSTVRLNLLIAQVSQYNRLIAGINSEIAHTDRQISVTTEQIRQMTNDIEKMKSEYARLVFQAYKNRGQYNKLIFVLSSKDFNEAYRRMKYFQQYGEFRKKQVAEILIIQAELENRIVQLTEQRAEREALLVERRRESAALQTVRNEQDREVARLRANERQLRTQLERQQREQNRIQNEIDRHIANEARRAGATVANVHERLTPEQQIISTNFRANRGRLPWPTERGHITRRFGSVPHPIVRNIIVNNPGIEITTISNADVRVVFEGEVSLVGGIVGSNMYVLVKHGNFYTAYHNLVDVKVKTGDKVNLREVIGKVYTEHGSPSATMRFEVREGSNTQNPELWITRM